MLYIVSGARSRFCILWQELGIGAVYCLRCQKEVLEMTCQSQLLTILFFINGIHGLHIINPFGHP